jgi:uncharacterized protein
MFTRNLEALIPEIIARYRCISLVGPRQSGKTTLCRKLFRDYDYYSFESPDVREMLAYDARGLLRSIRHGAIFDEVQKVPELLSYLQEILDDKADSRRFILTGSNNLKLSHNISQTLAGRTRLLQVLPLQRNELPPEKREQTIDATLWRGAYPRIYDENLDAGVWLGDYFQTYVEKDIRDTVNITNLSAFNNFVRLLAGRVGQLLSLNSLAGDAGITQPTAKSWLSALETTYICFTLQPHFNNFSKRIIKAPKIYFYDTGLLCYLLRIRSPEQLALHPLRGSIFENWVIIEMLKSFLNRGKEAPLYFWRDQHGHEVDLVLDAGSHLNLYEIKSGQTFHLEYMKNLDWLNALQGREQGTCIYGGDKRIQLGELTLLPWSALE